MATTVMRKPQKQVENEVEISEEQAVKTESCSVKYLKQVASVAISNILFIREVLPERFFNTRNIRGCNVKVMKSEVNEPLVRQLVCWLRGAFQAMEKRYLRQIILGIQPMGNSNLAVETYTFSVNYHTNGANIVSESGVAQTLRNADMLKAASIKMINTCIAVTRMLPPLPENMTISMMLTYHDNITPRDYEPPGFMASDRSEFLYPGKMASGRLGKLSTPFHTFYLTSTIPEVISCANVEGEVQTDAMEIDEARQDDDVNDRPGPGDQTTEGQTDGQWHHEMDHDISFGQPTRSNCFTLSPSPAPSPSLKTQPKVVGTGLSIRTSNMDKGHSNYSGNIQPKVCLERLASLPTSVPPSFARSPRPGDTGGYYNTTTNVPEMSQNITGTVPGSSSVGLPVSAASFEQNDTNTSIFSNMAISCVCNVEEDYDLMITCSRCDKVQHGACYGFLVQPDAVNDHACLTCSRAGVNIRCSEPAFMFMSDSEILLLAFLRRTISWLRERKRITTWNATRDLNIPSEISDDLWKEINELGVMRTSRLPNVWNVNHAKIEPLIHTYFPNHRTDNNPVENNDVETLQIENIQIHEEEIDRFELLTQKLDRSGTSVPWYEERSQNNPGSKPAQNIDLGFASDEGFKLDMQLNNSQPQRHMSPEKDLSGGAKSSQGRKRNLLNLDKYKEMARECPLKRNRS